MRPQRRELRGIKFVSWNVSRVAASNAGDILHHLKKHYGLNIVVGLQEVPLWTEATKVEGWEIHTNNVS